MSTEEQAPLLAGRYRLIETLGAGSMGDVYRAEDTQTSDRVVAVKLLSTEVVQEAGADGHLFVKRFKREVTAMEAVSHPNIIKVLGHGVDADSPDGLPFVVLEYLRGQELRDLLSADGALDPARAGRLAREVASALVEVHAAGLIHRDLKPENLFVQEAPNPQGHERLKLLDFGIARRQEVKDRSDRLTAVGTIVGTPAYMAPEQVRDKDVTSATDLYSLGVILYEMIAGEKPFDADNPLSIAYKHIKEVAPELPFNPAFALSDGLTARWRALVAQLMAKPPEDRVPSAKVLVERLDMLLAETRAERHQRNSPVAQQFVSTVDVNDDEARRRFQDGIKRGPSGRRGTLVKVVDPQEQRTQLGGIDPEELKLRLEEDRKARALAASVSAAATTPGVTGLKGGKNSPGSSTGRKWLVAIVAIVAIVAASIAAWVAYLLAR